jgi:hypothetical protein
MCTPTAYEDCVSSYVFDIDIGAHLNGSTVSTIPLQCDLPLERKQEFMVTSKSLADKRAAIMW